MLDESIQNFVGLLRRVFFKLEEIIMPSNGRPFVLHKQNIAQDVAKSQNSFCATLSVGKRRMDIHYV